ncbi:MAG TPA: hypothetical protein VGH81_02495 [Rudaea sp.]|jgi:hypothetical protein
MPSCCWSGLRIAWNSLAIDDGYGFCQRTEFLNSLLGKTDVFERRELRAKELPEIERRITEQRRYRYYQIEAWLPQHWPSNENDSKRFAFALLGRATDRSEVPFGHYDFERKGFLVPCFYLGSTVFGNHGNRINFDKSDLAFSPQVLLPVGDQGSAARLEQQLARFSMPSQAGFGLHVRLYFYAIGAPPFGPLHAIMTRMDFSILEPGHPERKPLYDGSLLMR